MQAWLQLGNARTIGIHTSAEAFEIIEGFYPKHLIPFKVQFGIEELMERVATEAGGASGVEPPKG